jgi:hypothetical protein
MRKVVPGVIIAVLGFYAYNRFLAARPVQPESAPPIDTDLVEAPTPAGSRFRCDGRVYCSQMTSCEEATWFLQNCPGVKMDGEGDGVPCEKQWCGRR